MNSLPFNLSHVTLFLVDAILVSWLRVVLKRQLHTNSASSDPSLMLDSIPENVTTLPSFSFPCFTCRPRHLPQLTTSHLSFQATRWVIKSPLSLDDCNSIAALLPTSCPDLQQLSLQGISISPEGTHDLLQSLSELTALRVLFLGSCRQYAPTHLLHNFFMMFCIPSLICYLVT